MEFSKVLVFFLAIFAVAATVSAISITDNPATSHFQVSVKGLDLEDGAVVNVFAGETIPLRVAFKANENAEDVRVRAWVSGHRSDIMDSTERFDVINDTWYTHLLSLKMPEDVDPIDDLVLVIRVEDKFGSFEKEFNLKIQRESFNVELISVETQGTVTAGESFSVDLVVKNRGSKELEDLFAVVRIPALNIEKKVYFSDIDPTDEEIIIRDNNIIVKNSDREDSAQRMISLSIPESAKPGVYALEVTAYNADVSEKVTKQFVVTESQAKSDVLAAVTSKEANVGQEATFDLILVNQGSRNKVFEIMPESVSGVTVNVDEPIVSVSGDSSKVVKVRVTPNKAGTYNFGINVDSEGALVKRVSLAVNAGGQTLDNSIVVLTVVLAIIFVVLLVVLIVLLTRKPSKEAEESYY